MKKFYILLPVTMVILFSVRTLAQPMIGFQGGLSLSKWTYKFNGLGYSINTDRISEITLGIPVEFRLSELFSLQPELNYVTKGGQLEQNDPATSSYFKSIFKIRYLEIPFFLKFSSGGPKYKLDLFAGPAYAYGLSGNSALTQTYNGITQTDKNNLDFKNDSIKRSDFSFNFGAGVSMSSGVNKFFFNIRYQVGLTNLAEPSNTPNSIFSFDVKDDTYFFTLGILTPIATKRIKPMTK